MLAHHRFRYSGYIAPVLFTALNVIAMLLFCGIFFYTLQTLPDTVPLHYSTGVGFDRWGDKTELYHLGIIPLVTTAVNTLLSILLIRKDLNWVAYFTNGITLFVTLTMALVAALMVSGAGSA